MILMFNASGGFQGCYHVFSSVEEQSESDQQCAKSYTAPSANDMTRRDSTIDFGPRAGNGSLPTLISDTNWNLSEINSLKYNFFNEGEPSRLRLPFAAEWSGRVSTDSDIRVTYIGSGLVKLGDSVTYLPANYSEPADVQIKNSGAADIFVQFSWTPNASTDTPFALLLISDSHGVPIEVETSMGQFLLTTFVGVFLWIAVLIITLLLLVFLFSRISIQWLDKRWIPIAVLLLAIEITSIFWSQQHTLLLVLIPVSLLLFLTIVAINATPAVTSVVAALSICVTAILVGISTGRSVDSLTYRDGGGDFLTYESYARTILTSGSLQAGEDIFIYSPAIRYWVFAQHLIFGDGDYLIYVLSIGFLLASVWFASFRLVVNPLQKRLSDGERFNSFRVWFAIATIAILGSLVGSTHVWNAGYRLLSEYPTWPLLAVALTMTLTGINRPRQLLITGALLGLALTFRGNQLPGIATIGLLALARSMYPLLLSRNYRGALSKAAFLLGPFLLISALPGFHNFLYGGRWVPLQTSLPLPENFPLPPANLLKIGSDPVVMETVKSQLQGLFVFTEQIYFGPFTVTVRIIQVIFVALLLLSVWNRFRGPWRSSLLAIIPFTFLLPHLFIQVYVYYPRHIVAGYFNGAIVLMAIAGSHISSKANGLRAEDETPSDRRSRYASSGIGK
jgi:hypothetical protein